MTGGLSFGDESPAQFIAASDARESAAARQLEAREMVSVALSALTPRQRVVLVRSVLYGDSAAEIGAFLEISESRVRGILAEAKAAGRKAIERALARPREALSLTN